MGTAASVPIKHLSSVRFGLVVAVVIAIALGVLGLAVRAGQPGVALPVVSLAERAQAIERAGAIMQSRGQAMLDAGRRSGDPDLIAHGEHWLRDGQMLFQRGRWLAMNPTAAGSLLTTPADLSRQGSWDDLLRTTQAMQQDPSRASTTDLEALNWIGLARRAEGQIMAEEGRVMAEDVEALAAQHGLAEPSLTDLREAARTLREVGAALDKSGQSMIDYADQLRRSLGYR